MYVCVCLYSRGVRRIGSGRIAMRHQDSLEDERGRNNGERRELPDLQSLRKQASADRFYRAGESRFTREREARSRDYDYHRDDDVSSKLTYNCSN